MVWSKCWNISCVTFSQGVHPKAPFCWLRGGCTFLKQLFPWTRQCSHRWLYTCQAHMLLGTCYLDSLPNSLSCVLSCFLFVLSELVNSYATSKIFAGSKCVKNPHRRAFPSSILEINTLLWKTSGSKPYSEKPLKMPWTLPMSHPAISSKLISFGVAFAFWFCPSHINLFCRLFHSGQHLWKTSEKIIFPCHICCPFSDHSVQ